MRDLDEQIANCDHVPFIHDLLSGKWVCLCGKTRLPVPPDCPCLKCKSKQVTA